MIARRQARQARHLSDDIDRLTRGDTPGTATTDPEHRALLAAAALLNRELADLRTARPGYQTALEARLLAQLPTVRRRWWQQLAPPVRPAWSSALVAIALLVLVIAVAGTAATASTLIRVHRPEGPKGNAPIVAPVLPPDCAVPYLAADPATTAQETGRALAYLPQPPAELSDSIEVGLLPTSPPIPATTIAMRTHAVVRYQGGGHTLLIALDEPSATLATQHEIMLGDRTIQLADGRDAWISNQPNLRLGNMVAWVSDGYIVIAASDLPLKTITALASQVNVAPAVASGVPSDTDPGTSPASERCRSAVPNGPADLTMSGEVRQSGSENHPQLVYQFKLGNRGGDTAQNVRVTIEPPAALATHVTDPAPSRTFAQYGPGQLSGFGGTITFDVAGIDPAIVRQALAEGLTIRITWTEAGKTQERTFTIR